MSISSEARKKLRIAMQNIETADEIINLLDSASSNATNYTQNFCYLLARRVHFREQSVKRKEHFMMSIETEAMIMHLLGADENVMEELLDFE